MRISDWSSDVCSSDLLILHGDEFDAVVMAHRWLALFGDFAYTTLLRLNVVVAAVRQRLGQPYWSLSKHAKSKVKNAVAFISRRSEEHTSELQSLMRTSYAVFCSKQQKTRVNT